MGFELPKLDLPRIPEITKNSEFGKLTKTFDPTEDINKIQNNVMNQLNSLETMRTQLKQSRDEAQEASSQLDFKALSSYTTGLQQMTDVSCVMGSAKPALTPLTPENISNPLSKSLDTNSLLEDAIGSLTGVDAETIDAVMSGDVESLASSDTVSDLAIDAAGLYVSGLTGGAIPPEVASNVIDSVAGDTVRSVVSSTMSGDMSSVSNLNISSLAGTDVLNSSISAIGSDASGSLLEGTLTKATSGIVDTISNTALSSLSQNNLTILAQSTVDSLGASNYGSDVGGLNLSDMSSRVDALASSVLNRAVTSGNIKASTNMLDVLYRII